MAKTLSETGLDPRRLDLELTESIVMADAEAVAADLRRLHDLGVSISIDDFGTGYSSLNYLNARSRALVERGEKPPHRAVQLIHGDLASEMATNTGRGLAEARLIPIEIMCRRRD